MIQGTDGTILVQSYDGHSWARLTPSLTGSYINGTWTMLASAPIARLYFANQILPNGNLLIVGGEYSGPGLLANWSNTGSMFNPLTNSWSTITPYPNQAGCPSINYVSGNVTAGSPHITNIYPYTSGLLVGWSVSGTGIPAGSTIVSIDSATQITISNNATATNTAEEVNFNHSYELTGCLGDEPSILLPGGNVLVGDLINRNSFIYNPSTNSWTPSGSKVYPDQSDEEGWNKQANGSVLTYDLWESVTTLGQYAEVYTPATGTWASISPSDGSASGFIPQLSNNTSVDYELGPQLRLQDGRTFIIGATPHNALYNPATNTWAAGPDTPGGFGADDAGAGETPEGHVIFAADSGFNDGKPYQPPTHIFDFDPVANTITDITASVPDPMLPTIPSFVTRFLTLPTGQLLFSDGSQQIYAYTPTGAPNPALRPVVNSFTYTGAPGQFTLTGQKLTGQSSGAAYGDDSQQDDNYPIVRLTNAAGNVYYCTTSNWSSTSVDGGTNPETVTVTLNPAISPGNYSLIVAGAGIPSFPVAVNITAAEI
jgi:hypothetical protein